MNYCKNCGNVMEDSQIFCGMCGGKVIQTGNISANTSSMRQATVKKGKLSLKYKIEAMAITISIILSIAFCGLTIVNIYWYNFLPDSYPAYHPDMVNLEYGDVYDIVSANYECMSDWCNVVRSELMTKIIFFAVLTVIFVLGSVIVGMLMDDEEKKLKQ